MNILKSLLFYSLAFWGSLNIIRNLPGTYQKYFSTISGQKYQLHGCDCGGSVVEAVSLGCKFDALSMAWLPEHCRDDELTAEFDTTGKGKLVKTNPLKQPY